MKNILRQQWKQWQRLLQKDKGENTTLVLPEKEKQLFVLSLGYLPVGELSCEKGIWTFKYTKQFILQSKKYHPIVGFPDLHKIYESETLWPFFLVRIPGLGQPAVREIIEKENIDINNEAQLLKRFGEKTLANTFTLAT